MDHDDVVVEGEESFGRENFQDSEVINPISSEVCAHESQHHKHEHDHEVFEDLSQINVVWNNTEINLCSRLVKCVMIFLKSEELLVFDLFLSAGVSLFNLCTITNHSPPIFSTLSIFAVCVMSYLAFQYTTLRCRFGHVVRNLVLVVRNWNHAFQLIVLIVLVQCMNGKDDVIRADYTDADGDPVHRYYHCTELYYGLNFAKSAYHLVLIFYAVFFGEITMYTFFSYTGKYFFKTFYMNRCKKEVVKAAVGRETIVSPSGKISESL